MKVIFDELKAARKIIDCEVNNGTAVYRALVGLERAIYLLAVKMEGKIGMEQEVDHERNR